MFSSLVVRLVTVFSILFSLLPLALSSALSAEAVVASAAQPAVSGTPHSTDSPLATYQDPSPPVSEPTPVKSKSALGLTLSAEPEGAAPGEVVTFTIVVSNPGEAAVSKAALDVTVPDNLRWMPDQPGWSFDAQAKRLSAKVSGSSSGAEQALASGAGVRLTLRLQAGDKLARVSYLLPAV